MKIYYIGGSPCSGKSTIAEMLTQEYDLYYYKIDDYLGKYINECATSKKQVCANVLKMTSDQIWMRDPSIQSDEEFDIYNEMFEFIMADLKSIETTKNIIVEGAALLPNLMKDKNYVAIIPTALFQLDHYSKRTWTKEILKDCKDQKKAFDNWMKRDIIFAEEVKKQCLNNKQPIIINDGSKPIDELYKQVCQILALEKR